MKWKKKKTGQSSIYRPYRDHHDALFPVPGVQFLFTWAHAGFLQFFVELLTIPFLLMFLFSFFFSLVKLFKKEHWKEYALIFTINLATVLLLIFATYAESAK